MMGLPWSLWREFLIWDPTFWFLYSIMIFFSFKYRWVWYKCELRYWKWLILSLDHQTSDKILKYFVLWHLHSLYVLFNNFYTCAVCMYFLLFFYWGRDFLYKGRVKNIEMEYIYSLHAILYQYYYINNTPTILCHFFWPPKYPTNP